jgi:hypothetical protein
MLLLAAVVAAWREHHFRGCKGTVLAYTCVRVARINFNSRIFIILNITLSKSQQSFNALNVQKVA